MNINGFFDKLLASINDLSLSIYNLLYNLKNEHFLMQITYLDISNRYAYVFWTVVFYYCIASINLVKNFAPRSESRPLPFKHRLIINILTWSRWIFVIITLYWLVINACMFYAIEYHNYFQADHQNLGINFGISLLSFIFILTSITFKLDKTPILSPILERNIIKKLNEISNTYQAKNSGKEIYNPEGQKRITKKYEV